MSTITQTVTDIAGNPDGAAWVFYSFVREAEDTAGVITTKRIHAYPVGSILSVELKPGPAVVNVPGDRSYTFTVPTVDSELWPLIEADVALPPDTQAAYYLAAAVESYLAGHPPSGAPTDGSVTVAKFAAATLVTAAETIAANNNDTTIPTSAAVSAAVTAGINAVIAGAPAALDTLDELAAALADDASFAATLTTSLTGKVTKNANITGATKTKVTYDAKGLVTAGADATQDDIGDGTTYKQYSGTEKTKLAGVASGATANDTDANLKARANHTGTQSADTLTDGTTSKAFLATERTKLSGIATGATANDTDANLKDRANHTGTQSADTLTDGTTNKAFLATERTKLSGISTGATANSSDATLLARANHTGTQSADTIVDGTTNKVLAATDKTRLASTSGTNTGDQTTVTGNAGTATVLQTSRTIDGQAFNGSADITVIAPGTHAATSKATPVDADELPLVDSAASNVLKRLTLANLKVWIKAWIVKADVGLGSVTNNAQYYPTGTDVAVADGGTGASTAAGALTNLSIPADLVLIQVGNVARAVGSGDFATATYVGRAFTAVSITYQFDTTDASGNTTVELRRNGSQVTSSNLTLSAANQVDGTGTDAARTATISQSFAAGDRISLQITAVGTTPGKGLRAWIKGTWN